MKLLNFKVECNNYSNFVGRMYQFTLIMSVEDVRRLFKTANFLSMLACSHCPHFIMTTLNNATGSICLTVKILF